MLKVGDKVRVREDLIVGSNYGGEMFCGGYMESLKGRIATIVEVYDCLSYDIDIDEDGWMWTEEMFEIIEKEVSVNMKELTFREVIANIKEGEVWENLHKTIEFKNNNFIVKSKIKKQNNYFVVNEYTTFKLKRPQYTFQEAFEAFEKGKEIKSCVTSYTFRKIDDYIEVWDKTEGGRRYLEFDEMFSLEEIRNKWYIND